MNKLNSNSYREITAEEMALTLLAVREASYIPYFRDDLNLNDYV